MAKVRLILSSDFTRLGRDSRDLSRRARNGELRRIRQGVYVHSKDWTPLETWERYPLLVHAAAMTLRSRTVFCRQSSAAIWGIPLLGGHTLVHACTADGSGGRSRAGVRRHHVDMRNLQIESFGGLLVTSRARTATDLAAFESFEQGVAAFDHVLNADPGRGLPAMSKQGIADTVTGIYSAAAARRILCALDFADPLSQSPGESVSRAFMHREGFTPPVLQSAIRDRQGLVGFSDFDWPESGIVGEFDGLVKYEKAEYLAGRTQSQVVVQEKLREDRIRATGRKVIRWTWSKLSDPRKFAEFLNASGVPRTLRPSSAP